MGRASRKKANARAQRQPRQVSIYNPGSCLSGATIRAPRLTACGRCGLSSRSRSRPCYDEAVSSATGACS
jgi:hypothetical protein